MSQCWVFTGAKSTNGYGRASVGGRRENGGRLVQVHRAVYEVLVGPIPEGLELDHLCGNRACYNPAHLEPVTHRENLLRGAGIAARNARKTECPHGHPYDEANTFITRRGTRSCRTCNRLRARKRETV